MPAIIPVSIHFIFIQYMWHFLPENIFDNNEWYYE